MLGTLHAQAERVITHIAGGLYRFQNNFHFSVFLVTPEGLIATDLINAEAVTWLEAEIDKRFDRPIKYLILSHDYADRSSGGEVIAYTATLFAVDFISTRHLPFRTFADSYYPDWVDTLRRVEQLEFDILAPGHGVMGTKQDVVDHRRYHENLYNAVVAAVRAGQSLEEIKASDHPQRVQGLGLVRQLARAQRRRGVRPRLAASPEELSAEIDAPSDPPSPMMPAHEVCGAFSPSAGIG